MENLIETNSLSYAYPTEEGQPNTVLRDISLSVPKGQFLAILGHNGSGKSTLAKHFNGILLPTEGSVTVLGIDTRDDDRIYDIRQNVGMVFQNPDNQIVATLVEEDVAFALENLGVPPVEMRRRVNEALQAVGMYEHRNSAPHQLSGGQKQRVAIAGVLAMQPACIVLDEPTAMLDPQGRREVMQTVLRLNRQQGVTVVLITHFMDEAVQADRVVVMDHGALLLDGTPREVFSQLPTLRAAGLDAPQATELADALCADGCAMSRDILTAGECVDTLSALLDAHGVTRCPGGRE